MGRVSLLDKLPANTTMVCRPRDGGAMQDSKEEETTVI